MHGKNPKVDEYLDTAKKWRAEMEKLRAILLDAGLTEELKWDQPTYTFQGKNVVLVQGFKEHCALLFCKGALLSDPEGVLHKPGANTQGTRRISFKDVQEVDGLGAVLKTYLQEAIVVTQAGLEVDYKTAPEPMPEELQQKLAATPALEKAFEGLTPGRQRAYILHFSAAKQSMTRKARIEKCAPRILAGKGMNDR